MIVCGAFCAQHTKKKRKTIDAEEEAKESEAEGLQGATHGGSCARAKRNCEFCCTFHLAWHLANLQTLLLALFWLHLFFFGFVFFFTFVWIAALIVTIFVQQLQFVF